MNWDRWTLFLLTDLLVCITPGPAVLMVLAQGLTRGLRPSLCASAGILTGSAICFMLSATGIGALLAASFGLFMVVKWLGAAYLVYLGLVALFGKASVLSVKPAAAFSEWRTYLNGIVLELSNPKCLLFFVVILPQFIDPREGLVPQIALLGVTSIVTEFIVLAAYGAFAGRFQRMATQPRFARATDRLAGSFLITAGVVTASSSRA